MAIKSPQEAGLVDLRATPGMRLQQEKAPQLNPNVVKSFESALDRRQKMQEKAIDIADQSFDNDADTALVRSVSTVVTQEGTNAIEQAKKQRDVFRKEIESKISKLSPELQGYFSSKVDKYLAKYDQTVIPHQYREAKKLEETIRKERIAYDRNDAITASGNLDAFNQGLNTVYARVVAYAKDKYGDNPEAEVPGMEGTKVKEIIDLTAKNTVSQTILGAIQQQAATGSLGKAVELGNRFNVKMTPEDRVKAAKAIEKAQASSENDFALQMATKAEQMHPENMEEQETFIRSISPSTKMYKQTMEVLRFNNTIREKAKKQREDKALADVNQNIMSGKFSPEMVKGLSPSKQAEVLRFATNYNQGKFTQTDEKTFNTLDDMIRDNPDAFASEVNLMTYRDKLNDREFRTLKMAQDRIRGEERGQQRRLAANPDRIVSRIFTEVIDNKQLWGKEAEVKQKSREFLEMTLEANPKITPTELRKVYSKFMYDELVKMEPNPEYNKFWSPIKNVLPFTSETPEEIPTLQSPTSPIEAPSVQIHPSHISVMKSRFPSATENEIMEYLKGLQRKGIRVDLPAQGYEGKK